jgi:hypothetical protein
MATPELESLVAARLCEGFASQDNGLRHSFISYRLAILRDTAWGGLEADLPAMS